MAEGMSAKMHRPGFTVTRGRAWTITLESFAKLKLAWEARGFIAHVRPVSGRIYSSIY